MLQRFSESVALPTPGTRIAADGWQPSAVIDDNITVPPGTQGTVEHSDELQIWVKWDNGSTINLVPGDRWRVV